MLAQRGRAHMPDAHVDQHAREHRDSLIGCSILAQRDATLKIGSPEPKITLAQAQEMFRKLFQGWIQELKKHGTP